MPTTALDQEIAVYPQGISINLPEEVFVSGTANVQQSEPKNYIVPPPINVTPDNILLGFIDHYKFRLRSPIPVKIEREDDFVVAIWAEIDEFGYGKHLTEALEDLAGTIADLYLGLEERQENLGSDLQKTWKFLQDWIEKR